MVNVNALFHDDINTFILFHCLQMRHVGIELALKQCDQQFNFLGTIIRETMGWTDEILVFKINKNIR